MTQEQGFAHCARPRSPIPAAPWRGASCCARASARSRRRCPPVTTGTSTRASSASARRSMPAASRTPARAICSSSAPTAPDGPTWLVRIRDGRLAVAFEFESHAAAASAVPPQAGRAIGGRDRRGGDLGTRQARRLDGPRPARRRLHLQRSRARPLADRSRDRDQPAAAAARGDRRAHPHRPPLPRHGPRDHRGDGAGRRGRDDVRRVGGDVPPGRWRILEYVEDGRIKSTTRYPDLPGE